MPLVLKTGGIFVSLGAYILNIDLIFDGGNGASVEKEAYGSYQYNVDNYFVRFAIERVSFGIGYTNNEAEYMTLISALEYIIAHYNAADVNLHIRGDSELVRNQIGTIIDRVTYRCPNAPIKVTWRDVWQVKKKHLLPYRYNARALLERFKSFTYEHIPRKDVVEVLGH